MFVKCLAAMAAPTVLQRQCTALFREAVHVGSCSVVFIEGEVGQAIGKSLLVERTQGASDGALVVFGGSAPALDRGNVIRAQAKVFRENLKCFALYFCEAERLSVCGSVAVHRRHAEA